MFIILFTVWGIRKKADLKRRRAFYEKQSIAFHPGASDLMGAIDLLDDPLEYYTEEIVKSSKFRTPLERNYGRAAVAKTGKDFIEGGAFPVYGGGVFFKLSFIIMDPFVLQDFMTTKNKFIDKDGFQLVFFGDTMIESFL